MDLISLDDPPADEQQRRQAWQQEGQEQDTAGSQGTAAGLQAQAQAFQSAEDLLSDSFGTGSADTAAENPPRFDSNVDSSAGSTRGASTSAGSTSSSLKSLNPPHPDGLLLNSAAPPSSSPQGQMAPSSSTEAKAVSQRGHLGLGLNENEAQDSFEQADEPILPEAQTHGAQSSRDAQQQQQQPNKLQVEQQPQQQQGEENPSQQAQSDMDNQLQTKSFNFQEFLQKMRHPSAYTLVQPVKEFIAENSHPIHNPQDAVPLVHDFLDSLKDRIAQHELWKDVSEAELDNAYEGMEKYILSKLYRYYFQPEASDEAQQDQALADRMRMLSFIKPEHLEIPPACLEFREQLASAQTELIKMDSYKAPRDKAICILNCVKLIMSVLEMTASETGADAFIPLLSYVVLQARPPNLLSNLQYIERFRDPNKFRGEMAYYVTNVMVCTEFIRSADASRFHMEPEEFEEQLTRQLQEMHPDPSSKSSMSKPTRPPPPPPHGVMVKTTDAQPLQQQQQQQQGPHPPKYQQQQQDAVLASPELNLRDRTDTITAARSTQPTGVGALPSQLESNTARQQSQHPLPSPAIDKAVPSSTSTPRPPHSAAAPSPTTRQQQQQQQGRRAGRDGRTESEDFTDLVRRAEAQPIERFRTIEAADLTMADIPVLLRDYKRLAQLNEDLTKTLNLNLGL